MVSYLLQTLSLPSLDSNLSSPWELIIGIPSRSTAVPHIWVE